MLHIAFVSPYEELTELAQSMSAEWKEKGVLLDVTQAIGSDAASKLKIRADAVICRGVTGVALRKVLAPSMPFVEIKTTGYDVIQAVRQCQNTPANPKPFTVIGTKNMVYGLQQIIDMFDVELECHLIGSEAEARACLEKLVRIGPRTIIGGSTIAGVAEHYGIPTVLIRSGEESVRQAVEDAVKMAAIALQERTLAEQTRISMNALAEGIIMLNREGIITECNTAAERLLCATGNGETVLSGSSIDRFIPHFRPDRVLSGHEDFCMMCAENGINLAVGFFPVTVDGDNRGAVATLQEVSRVQELEENIRFSLRKKGHTARYTFSQCLGRSKPFVHMLKNAWKYSKTEAGVLLFGETGTGKEMVAQSMHHASPRAKGPFVAVNCAAFPENLLESMLFGYVGGAFTGAAKEGRQGFFELAHGGTLFLDEISEIPPYLQGRLLRVLQEREILRLGHERITPVNVRVIAATNRPIQPLLEQGLFRQDLLYRLNVLGLTLPPLRERDNDVELLMRHFLDAYGKKTVKKSLKIDVRALALLYEYPWFGNVRELHNFCERLSVLATSNVVTVEDMAEAFSMGEQTKTSAPTPQQRGDCMSDASQGLLKEAGMRAIAEALTSAGGNKGLAAARLGISRSTLWRKLKTCDISG